MEWPLKVVWIGEAKGSEWIDLLSNLCNGYFNPDSLCAECKFACIRLIQGVQVRRPRYATSHP